MHLGPVKIADHDLASEVGALVAILPEDGLPTVSLGTNGIRPRHTDFASHASEITSFLGKLEASSVRVGIPLLLASDRLLSRRLTIDTSLNDFVRVNLVGVSTESLRQYFECLGEAQSRREYLSAPSITLTPTERYGAIGMLSLLVSAVAGLATWVTTAHMDVASAVLMLVLGSCAVIVFPLCSDDYRCRSFAEILNREIARRSGTDPDQPGNLQICPSS